LYKVDTKELIVSAADNSIIEISPINDELGFEKFKNEYGVASKQLCGRLLDKMGLINFEEK
jgi:hypothetical protein